MPSSFDLQLSELAHINSLVKVHRIAGLNPSAASILHDMSALRTAQGGLLRLRQQTETILGMKSHFHREAKQITGVIEGIERVRMWNARIFSNTYADVERYRRMVSTAIGPLSALRSASLYESEAARLGLRSHGLLSAAGIKSYTNGFTAAEQVRKQQELLATTFGESLAERWLSSARVIAKQFASVTDIIPQQLKAWRSTTVFDPAWLARGIGMPVMDAASFETIARTSGVNGLLAQLKSFGIDETTLQAVASTMAEDEGDVEDLLCDSNKTDGASHRQLTRAQLLRLWNIVFIVYSVLFPLYTWWDSNQVEARRLGDIKAAEARTSAEIRASEHRTGEKVVAMIKLMEQVVELAEQQVIAERDMVVRERVAIIMAEPRSGAAVIAEAFPNQVVTLLEERGKWIKVVYYDWLAHDERIGWSLKKYFVRVKLDVCNPRRDSQVRAE
ncbi:SH3 domain-containing protein [Alcaligenes sp. A-TC2]|uniref:SH3 domain-containing protein n=1 Tax=Alcaligenes nematophilus TaxID=2994643 RepID=UPI002257DBAD|nr:SH3 domain-containing protein [Alcaligenes nematophilus]MCX5470201.1 SH3 domain-containing protein [Alcaligenes nematophilus]